MPGRAITDADHDAFAFRYGPAAVWAVLDGLLEVRRDVDGAFWMRPAPALAIPDELQACAAAEMLAAVGCPLCEEVTDAA